VYDHRCLVEAVEDLPELDDVEIGGRAGTRPGWAGAKSGFGCLRYDRKVRFPGRCVARGSGPCVEGGLFGLMVLLVMPP
jgi:hypothetical protein